MPRAQRERLPVIITYHGYTCGRGFGFQYLQWAAAGYAHFVMDNRGQGATCLVGDTPDIFDGPMQPFGEGYMTRGVLSPETYYFRRLYSDAVRFVEAIQTCEWIDPARITLEGISAGGVTALAVCAFVPEIQAAMFDVPFGCHFRRAVRMTDAAPYSEISAYLRANRDKVAATFATLDYFDGVNFAARAHSQALFSVGLMDEVCPPSTVFAAYNHYRGAKAMSVWEFNHHDGGGIYHEREKLRFVRDLREQRRTAATARDATYAVELPR